MYIDIYVKYGCIKICICVFTYSSCSIGFYHLSWRCDTRASFLHLLGKSPNFYGVFVVKIFRFSPWLHEKLHFFYGDPKGP